MPRVCIDCGKDLDNPGEMGHWVFYSFIYYILLRGGKVIESTGIRASDDVVCMSCCNEKGATRSLAEREKTKADLPDYGTHHTNIPARYQAVRDSAGEVHEPLADLGMS